MSDDESAGHDVYGMDFETAIEGFTEAIREYAEVTEPASETLMQSALKLRNVADQLEQQVSVDDSPSAKIKDGLISARDVTIEVDVDADDLENIEASDFDADFDDLVDSISVAHGMTGFYTSSSDKREWKCPHCKSWNEKWIGPSTCPSCLESVTGEYETRGTVKDDDGDEE